jgi:precorrin-6A/cobalt-precorrin-6A reductase
MAGRRILILGGTTEAAEVAQRLNGIDSFEVITSMAGVTRAPRLPAGKIRSGGFGGADGLTTYLRDQHIAAMIDATHPFAAQISRHAAEAAATVGVPVLHLLRPVWRPQPGVIWHEVASPQEAASWLNASKLADEASVFLTIGRTELMAFANARRLRYIARSIEDPGLDIINVVDRMIMARGPFTRENEQRFLLENDVVCLVAKNSGGDASYPKIQAARELGLPVVMIQRPPPPSGDSVHCVEDVVTWVQAMPR